MIYNDYIQLGFSREDLTDNVLFNQTGYFGFILTKDLGNGWNIALCDGEFDTPKLYFNNDFICKLNEQSLNNICKNLNNYLC